MGEVSFAKLFYFYLAKQIFSCYIYIALILMCIAPIAQLDRAFDYESKGCGFDSCSARHLKKARYKRFFY